jgi:rhodanese-related sulfurtransferase
VTLPTVAADELKRKLECGGDFVLVDALAPMVYAHSHLPGAINLPASNVDPDRVARRIPDRSTEIIVYCSSEDCDDSVVTADKLVQLGYTNVKHYAGGKDEWRDLGLPLERAGKPYVPEHREAPRDAGPPEAR